MADDMDGRLHHSSSEGVGGEGGPDAACTALEGPTTNGAEADKLAPCSLPNTLPPGYMLVTVLIEGQAEAAIQDLPIEVLPCHTFADVCAAALARVQGAPQDYDFQAFMQLEHLQVPLQNPHTSARDTLRTFPGATALIFRVGPPHGRTGPRTVRVNPLRPRRQRQWPQRLARIVIGVAKVVLAVEAAALVRGGSRSALRQLRRTVDWLRDGGGSGSEGGSGSYVGSETEEALDAVADYVSGRAELGALRRFRPQAVVRALEAVDTEVLEQLDVPDVPGTKAAVASLLRQLREDQAVPAAAAAAPSPSDRPEGGSTAYPPEASTAGRESSPQAAAPGGSDGAGAGTGVEAAVEAAPEVSDRAQDALPGFGPGTPTGKGPTHGGRGR